MQEPFVQPFSVLYKNHHVKVDVIKYGARHIENWNDAVLIRPYWRIFWANKKGARLVHDDRAIELGSEHMTIIPPYLGVEHDFYEPFDVFHMNVDLGKPFYSYKSIFQVSVGEDYLKIIKKILTNPKDDSFVRQTELTILMMKVISELEVSYFDLKSLPEKIEKVVQYMEHHYGEHLSNEFFAEMCDLSINSFIRVFSQATKVSPQEYLKNIRLDASVNLLIKTNLDISEISQQCGFTERNYFSRVFSKRFKMGPAQYRKEDSKFKTQEL